MPAVVFGKEHFIYMGVSALIGALVLILGKKYIRTERGIQIFLKSIALLLFVSIMANRLSQVYRYSDVNWVAIIPDSYCGMTSLLLSLAVLFGKKDNCALHFMWILAIFGGISTVIYPAFIGQGPTVFYLPTISGLLHHSFSAILGVALLLFDRIYITYKKWYYTFFGFTAYVSVGAFLIGYFGIEDAFHIYTPLLSDTPLTTWIMAPIYAVCYAIILIIIELVRKKRRKNVN